MNKNGLMWRLLRKGKRLLVKKKHQHGLRLIMMQAKGDEKKLYYFGYPEHANMGDLGQYYCVQKWLKANYADYIILELPSSIVLDDESGFQEWFKKAVVADDLLVIHSGYNTNDLSTVSNKLNLLLMSNYQQCKLIVLPQTVFFREEKKLLASAKVFSTRKNMVFMARDKVSYDISKRMMPDGKVMMVPDIVTTLIGSRPEQTKRNGIVLCHRHDGEMLYTDADFKALGQKLADVDICVIMDTTVTKSYKEIMRDLYGAMLEIIEQFEHGRIVITDRYHGMIYSLVSNTPVIVLKTTDHKVIEGYHILKEIYPNRIWFASSMDEAEQVCRMVLKQPDYSKLDNYFQREIYAKLPERIEQELRTIKICDEGSCTGCGVCAEVCPFHAITMKPDALGFPYPIIDENACKHCGICHKKCHVLKTQNQLATKSQSDIYAGWNKSEEIRRESTSGGAFSAFADAVLNDGGYVMGAAFDYKFNVVHRIVSTKEELAALRGSKYVQSNIQGVLAQMNQCIKDGKKVLFTGTSCQVSAVNQFFSNSQHRQHLYTIDVVCHGVGAPAVFLKYLNEKMKTENGSKLSVFKFRDKHFSWRNSSVYAQYKSGESIRTPILIDPYMVGFNRNVFLREACFNCQYTNLNRVSDITLSDFWGYLEHGQRPDDDTGVSMVMVNTDKGRQLLEAARDMIEITIKTVEDALRGQPCLQHPSARPVNRSDLEKDIAEPFDQLQKKYLQPWWNFSSFQFYRSTHNRAKAARKMGRMFFRYLDAITVRLKIREAVNRCLFGKRLLLKQHHTIAIPEPHSAKNAHIL